MQIKKFLLEAFRNTLYALFPIYILYINFIFLGIFILGKNEFSQSTVFVLFIIFNILLSFNILYYVLLLTTESKSTQDIFPLALERHVQRNYKNINPFITEALLDRSIDKTRICEICKTYKPPRCHHCSRCNRCCLKFDHHCTFVDVCIGFHNYKYYVQFCVTNFIMLIYYLIFVNFEFSIIDDLQASIIVNVVITDLLTIIVLFINAQTLVMTVKLLPNNETITEYYALNAYIEGDHTHINIFQEGPITTFSVSKDRKVLNPYNLGTKENLREVFGDTFMQWISPSFTSKGDGLSFRKNNSEKTSETF